MNQIASIAVIVLLGTLGLTAQSRHRGYTAAGGWHHKPSVVPVASAPPPPHPVAVHKPKPAKAPKTPPPPPKQKVLH